MPCFEFREFDLREGEWTGRVLTFPGATVGDAFRAFAQAVPTHQQLVEGRTCCPCAPDVDTSWSVREQ